VASLDARHGIYLLLLVAALIGVFVLADAFERVAVPEVGELSFSPPSGAYDRSQSVEILPSHPRAVSIFTTNGTVPTATVGTLYERPLRLDSDVPRLSVIRAREFVDGVPGPVKSASYAVGVAHSLPILSIIADPTDLWGPERGVLANPGQSGQEWERPVYVTFFERDGNASFEIPAGLRSYPDGPPALGYGEPGFDQPKQSVKLYFRGDYGASRLEYPLFLQHQQDIQSYKRLLVDAEDKSGRWTLLGGQLYSDIVAEFDGNTTQGRYVLFFLNGEPWGIYRLAEHIDRFFLEDNLGILSADLIQDGRALEGDDQQWGALMRWVATHDLSGRASFADLETRVDVQSLTNHAILQLFFAQSGETIYAVRARDQNGRWFWLNGNGRQRIEPTLDAALTLLKPTDNPSDLALLLGGLLDNPDYRAFFVNRTADLLNTTLAPQAIEADIDRLAAQLRSDIGFETARWPVLPISTGTQFPEQADVGSEALEWERNVEVLKQFAQDRPDALRRQLVSEFGLRGTATLTFSLSAEENGYIVVNGLPIYELPWRGTHFLDSEVQIIAVPEPGYVFGGWESCLDPSCQDERTVALSPSITLTVDGPRSILARFVPLPADDLGLRPNDVIIDEYWINDDGTRYASVAGHAIEGDWFELLVTRPRTVDLRGWRITDNDHKISLSEGSIIFPPLEAFAAVPRGTTILIIATENNANEAQFPWDDLDPSDGQMVLYVGNEHLNVTTDPGFNIGAGDDNIVLLAPGSSLTLADDVGIDFVGEGDTVTPYSFGVLADGVTFDAPFRGLGNDDGVVFTGAKNNDYGDIGWIVDPAPSQSGDDPRPGATNILSPGRPNYGQNGLKIPASVLGILLLGMAAVAVALWLRSRSV
jgi:hypothetical protein